MAYPTYTTADLAAYSGRDETEYTAYANEALLQATLLFKIGTCLVEPPEDAIKAELMRYAILSMADAIVLSQPYQTVLSNPFSSETIGSYSYSKAASAVANGLPTGISWFDLAVTNLSVCNEYNGLVAGGAIEMFEDDGPGSFVGGKRDGNVRFVSPEDVDSLGGFFHDPTLSEDGTNSPYDAGY